MALDCCGDGLWDFEDASLFNLFGIFRSFRNREVLEFSLFSKNVSSWSFGPHLWPWTAAETRRIFWTLKYPEASGSWTCASRVFIARRHVYTVFMVICCLVHCRKEGKQAFHFSVPNIPQTYQLFAMRTCVLFQARYAFRTSVKIVPQLAALSF